MSYGEGSVYQRADGKWVAQIEAGHYPNGERRRARRTAHTERAAKQIRDRLNRQRQFGDLTNQTVARYLADWLTAKQSQVKPNTYKDHRNNVDHLLPHLGHVRLAELKPQQIRTALAALTSKKDGSALAPKTVQNVRTTIHAAMKQAVRDGVLERNPVDAVARPHVEQQDPQILTVDEARALLDALDGDRLEPLWTVVTALGLRLSEGLGLTWGAVDLDRGALQVHRQLQRVGKHYRLAELKSGKSRRTVALPAVAVESLRQHKARQAQERLAAESWPDGCCVVCGGTGWGLLFTTWSKRSTGRALSDTVPRNHLGEVSERVLGRRVNPHLLRHTAATLLLAQGLSPALVQHLLGHASVDTTVGMYGHLDVEATRATGSEMDRLLGG